MSNMRSPLWGVVYWVGLRWRYVAEGRRFCMFNIIICRHLLGFTTIFEISFHYRSESPLSSPRSSPPISPGCEDQQINMRLDMSNEFKKPIPPHSPMRAQDFPLYTGGHPYQLLAQGGSAFHRPLDPTGKPMPVIVSISNASSIQFKI